MRAIALAACLALAGCGYVGPPQAPALNIPVAVKDLAAGEYGSNILVRFTLPDLTTEGLTLKGIQSVELFIGPTVSPFSTDAWAASAKRIEIPGPPAPGPVTFQTPAGEWIGKSVVIGVRSTGPKGKVSGWSNLRPLDVGTPLNRPSSVKAENNPRGVGITWQGSAPRYRVLRAVDNGALILVGETTEPNYLDETTVYGTQYTYQVLAVASEDPGAQQSEISELAKVTPKDVFPPAVPAAVAASTGVNSIEIAWTRNTEADLQGYIVYRSTDGGAFEKIADILPTPVFSDMRIESGKRYRYAITSVDTSGNESMRSEPVEVVAP